VEKRLGLAVILASLASVPAVAQLIPESTRFDIVAAPILSQPKGDFARNIGNTFGGGGGVFYHVDRPGFLSVGFDLSVSEYGHETKQVPISERVSDHPLKVTTTNSIVALTFGPEFALPKGIVRPYVNAGISELFFRTTSTLEGTETSDGNAVGATNYTDATGAWLLGGGVRIPLLGSNPRKALSLDAGFRYYWGGTASYLREGSIQDRPDGSIFITPLSSRTSHAVYVIGVHFRIPHNPANPCPRFLC
jgi:hypothetical protein